MKTVSYYIKTACILLTVPAIMGSCDSVIYDDEGDCSVSYRIQFIDDVNLKFADAFSQEVNSVTLYAFNADGTFVWSKSESGATIHPAGSVYAMDITDLQPGTYHLVAWAGLEDNTSFSVPTMTPGVSTLQDLTCTLNRTGAKARGIDLVNTRLTDIFHGMTDITIPADDTPGTHTYEMQLTKDTNGVNVVLQEVNGESLNADDYTFEIVADNGHINYDNSLMTDEASFIYQPWNQQSTVAGYYTYDEKSREVAAQTSAVLANMTISRLVQQSDWQTYPRPLLNVYNSRTEEKILSVPLIDYALLVRGKYARIADDQDYLDRQDEYNMTFFLKNDKWLMAEIIINSWRIILNNEDIN